MIADLPGGEKAPAAGDLVTGVESSDSAVFSAERGIAVAQIRRPPHNFLDEELLHRTAQTCDELAADPSWRVVVLCSDGKNFSAGAGHGEAPTEAPKRAPHAYENAARLTSGVSR